jgi:hypothetical protein
MRVLRSVLAALALTILLVSSTNVALARYEVERGVTCDRESTEVRCNACGLGTTPDKIIETYLCYDSTTGRTWRETYSWCDYVASCDHNK